MRMPQRRKSVRPLEVEERRKKAAQEPTQVSPSVTPSKIPLSARQVALGRNVDFKFLRHDGFTIGEKLIKQGQRFFLNLSESVYIDLVKKFYSNLVFTDGVLRSMVKGVQIILNAPRLDRLLQMPYESSCLDELPKKKLDTGLSLEEKMQKDF